MYVLQAILLILKLVPLGRPLCSYGEHSHWHKLGGGDGKFFYLYFGAVDWWIVMIPSYFIIAKGIFWFVKEKWLEGKNARP